MKNYNSLIAGVVFCTGICSTNAQNVGINTTGATPNVAAILDLNTGNGGTMGFLPEQVALTATNSALPLTLPPTGIIVYNTATAGASPTNVTPGYYFNAGTSGAPNWVQMVAGNSNSNNMGGWLLNGNTGTNPATNFVGTTDANALNFRTNNTQWMTILSSGLVGINTAAPGYNLEVDANVNAPAGYFNNANVNGTGVEGINTAAAGTNTGNVGVYGVSNQYVTALPLSGGVFGYNTNNNTPGSFGGTGVIGVGCGVSGNLLLQGQGGAFTGYGIGLYAFQTNGANSGVAAGNFQDARSGNQVDVNAWNLGTHYKIISTFAGSVSCSRKAPDGRNVVLHCPETPEIYYEDYGEGKLVGGKAHVNLDPIYASMVTVNGRHPIRVFIQPVDDTTCKGVVVINRTPAGFDVVELNGGRSNTAFEWHVICNAKDEILNNTVNHLQDIRFETAPAIAPNLVQKN